MRGDGYLMDRSRVVETNFSDKDILFTLWFYSTNLRHPGVSVYKKEVEKPSTDIDKRDVENGSSTDRETIVAKDLAVVKNQAVIKDRDKKDIEKPGRSDLLVVEDLVAKDQVAKNSGRVDVEDRDREDGKKALDLA